MSEKTDKLADQLSEVGKPEKGEGEASTHYIRFEDEQEIEMWNSLCSVANVSRNKPEDLKSVMLAFIGENLEDFEEFVD